MTNFILAAAPTAPPPPLSVWRGVQHVWQGANGLSFALDAHMTGVVLLQEGVIGLHLPEFDQFVDESASVAGARYRGSRARSREVEWMLGIYGHSSAEFLERDRAFWSTVRPDQPGTWTVILPDGTRRSLRCRFRSADQVMHPHDPVARGWAVYQVTLLAEQPFWQGQEVASPTWGAGDSTTPFTGDEDEAPPFYISSATTLGSASIANPGDVPEWLTYRVEGGTSGGLSGVVIEHSGGKVEFGAVAEGEVLEIRTNPEQPLALLDGADVTGSLVEYDPRPIPPGETTPLAVTLSGSGKIRAFFTPRYYRAW